MATHRSEEDNKTIDTLYRISSLVNRVEDPNEALEVIIDEIVSVLPAGSASIELINPDTHLLEIEVMRGLPEESREVRLALGQGITGWVALHGQPLIIGDVYKDPRYISLNPDVRSEIAVPMIGSNGIPIGVVNIDNAEVNAFTEDDLKLLTLFTNEATKVVDQLWMIKKLREQTDQLRALINTGRSIVKKRELSSVLQSITNETLELMKCRLCALFLYEPKTGHLILHAISGAGEEIEFEERLDLDETAVGTAIRRRKIIEVYDLAWTEENHFVPLVQKLGLVSMLSCPIEHESEVIGVLNAYTDVPHRFNNSEKRIFETLAGLSGVAIQNARLYSRIFNSEETLRKTERLTTLGLLSAEIAHEIRNPLFVIRLLFDALNLEFDPADVRTKDVAIIGEKLDQLEGIVSRVLSFGKSHEDVKVRLDLRVIVRDVLHLVRLKLQQSRIELEVDECEGRLTVDASQGQLQQTILNLIINATQVMPSGGQINVRVYVEKIEGIRAGVVAISDTGPGVSEDIQGKIFDSFLTSSPEGTGLGLAISKRIMKSHKGDVELVSTSSRGTTMRIWLPLS